MKKLLSIVTLLLLSTSLASAQVGGTITRSISPDNMSITTTDVREYNTPAKKVYPTSDAFLKAEGNTCKQATDGCNYIQVLNGKLGASTLMMCEPKKQNQWSCLMEHGELSENDQNLYNHLKNTLPAKSVKQIDTFMKKYKENLTKFTQAKKLEMNTKNISVIDQKISNILMKYPQDKALPKKVNEVYLTLQLIQLEMQTVK